jgi:hypothetical protein
MEVETMQTNLEQRYTEEGRTQFIPPSTRFNPRIHEVARVDEKVAREFVLRVHYSGTFPAARRCFGLFRSERLLGVAVFSVGVNSRTLTNAFGGEARESLELGRFCLLDEAEFNAETFFLGHCRQELRREGFRGIVTFADDFARTTAAGEKIFAGHIGTIYAASSAIYTGRAARDTLRILPDGRVFSKRAVQKIRKLESGASYAAATLERYGADPMPQGETERLAWLETWLGKLTRKVTHPGNHRYLMPLQKGLNLPAGRPYPKVNPALN